MSVTPWQNQKEGTATAAVPLVRGGTAAVPVAAWRRAACEAKSVARRIIYSLLDTALRGGLFLPLCSVVLSSASSAVAYSTVTLAVPVRGAGGANAQPQATPGKGVVLVRSRSRV